MLSTLLRLPVRNPGSMRMCEALYWSTADLLHCWSVSPAVVGQRGSTNQDASKVKQKETAEHHVFFTEIYV